MRAAGIRGGTVVLAALVVVLLAACAGEGSTDAAPGDPDAAPAGPAPTPPTSEVTTTEPPCSAPPSADAVTVAYRSIEGVDPDATSLDVHPVAGACGAPVVVWVHGGGYRTGDKANQVRDKVRLFNTEGWIFVSVNYRLTDAGQPGSASFPDHFEDVAAAVAWVQAEIAAFGGDPSRIALLGHSAGADIVSNVAVEPSYLAAHGLDLRAIRCVGPLDSEGFDKVAAGARDPDGEVEQWRIALGNDPDDLRKTSATALVRPGIGIPPMIGVVRGSPLRQRIETAFLAAVEAAGSDSTTIDARALTHAEVNTSIGAPGDTVMTPPLVAFLRTCLGPP